MAYTENISGKRMTSEEKKQIDILIMVLKNFDISQFSVRALRVLDENSENRLALMVYHANFDWVFAESGEKIGVRFNESYVTEYLEREAGAFGFEAFMAIAHLVAMKATDGDVADTRLYNALLYRAHTTYKNEKYLTFFYDCITSWLEDSDLNREFYRQLGMQEDPNMFLLSAHGKMFTTRKYFADLLLEQLKTTADLPAEKRKALVLKILATPLYQKDESQKKGHVGWYIGAGVGIALAFLLFLLLL